MVDLVQTLRRISGPITPPVRDVIANSAALIGLTDPLRRAKGRLTIITFHRVLREAERRMYPLPGLAVTPEELSWFLKYFTANYVCGPVSEMVRRWLSARSSTSPLLAISFDDGQRDNYENARPVLDRFRVRASFYIPVQNIDTGKPIWHDQLGFAVKKLIAERRGGEKLYNLLGVAGKIAENDLVPYVVEKAKKLIAGERATYIRSIADLNTYRADLLPEWAAMMTWPDVKRLADEEHEIGSHSMTHPILPLCDDDEVIREVLDSRKIIEKRLEIKVKSFSYPNGSYDQRVMSAVRRAGYECAVTTEFGMNKSGNSPYTLQRCDMRTDNVCSYFGNLSRPRLALRLSGLHPGLKRVSISG